MQNFILFRGSPQKLVEKCEDLRDNSTATNIVVVKLVAGHYMISYDTP